MKCFVYTITLYRHGKAPINRASWEKGIRPDISRGTVNRGTIHIDFYIKLFWGIVVRPGKWRDPVNHSTVNHSFAVP